ncbi:uncharacterized protein LOC143256462 [Tachypleus tridentatus]|uniref:uncharacterized protein LOC143256462 n=1 Tax=Tachypleus tridentatus TaxID=6853 RepID=UPI003FD63E42
MRRLILWILAFLVVHNLGSVHVPDNLNGFLPINNYSPPQNFYYSSAEKNRQEIRGVSNKRIKIDTSFSTALPSTELQTLLIPQGNLEHFDSSQLEDNYKDGHASLRGNPKLHLYEAVKDRFTVKYLEDENISRSELNNFLDNKAKDKETGLITLGDDENNVIHSGVSLSSHYDFQPQDQNKSTFPYSTKETGVHKKRWSNDGTTSYNRSFLSRKESDTKRDYKVDYAVSYQIKLSSRSNDNITENKTWPSDEENDIFSTLSPSTWKITNYNGPHRSVNIKTTSGVSYPERNVTSQSNFSKLFPTGSKHTNYSGSTILNALPKSALYYTSKSLLREYFSNNTRKSGVKYNSRRHLGMYVSNITRKPDVKYNTTSQTYISDIIQKLRRQCQFMSYISKDDSSLTETSNLQRNSTIQFKESIHNYTNIRLHSSSDLITASGSIIIKKLKSQYNMTNHFGAGMSSAREKSSLKHRNCLFILIESLNRNMSHQNKLSFIHSLRSQPVSLSYDKQGVVKTKLITNNQFHILPIHRNFTSGVGNRLRQLLEMESDITNDKLFNSTRKKVSDLDLEMTDEAELSPSTDDKKFSPHTSRFSAVRTKAGRRSKINFSVKEHLTISPTYSLKHPPKHYKNTSQFSSPKSTSVVVANISRSSSEQGLEHHLSTLHLQSDQQDNSVKLFTSVIVDSLPGDEESSTFLNFQDEQNTETSKEIIHANYVTRNGEHSLRNFSGWGTSQNKLWGFAWGFHVYFTGSLFGLLALYSFLSILRLRRFEKLFYNSYFISISLIIFVMGIIRVLYLLFNPYNTQGFYFPVMNYFILNSGFLCVTSAFAVLCLALIQVTEIKVLPKRVQNSCFLAGILFFQSTVCISTDILHGLGLAKKLLLLTRQISELLWAMTLTVGYFHSIRKLQTSAVRKEGKMVRVALTRLHIEGAQLPRRLPKSNLCLAVRLTTVTAVFNALLVALHMFGIIYVYDVFRTEKPELWAWWGYQLCARLLELLVCLTISFIVTLPMRQLEPGKHKCYSFFFQTSTSVFACCCSSENEEVESEIFPFYSANYQGQSNVVFSTTPLEGPRPLNHTSSLPTILSFTIESENSTRVPVHSDKLQWQTNPSAPTLLSPDMSKQTASQVYKNNSGAEPLKLIVPQRKPMERGFTSVLYLDQGYIRFRREQQLDISEDELPEEKSCYDENDSIRANAGSSMHTLCEDDFVQASLSPFFRTGFYHSRFKRMSRWSLDTTDNSVELSPEQLSNVALKTEHSNSVLDFVSRKQGSTCSSESADNSFNVAFFHNHSVGVSVNVSQTLFGEVNDEMTFINKFADPMGQNFSPVVSSVQRHHDFQLNLDLPCTTNVEHVNVACGTEDITPDSAIYLDLQFTQEDPVIDKNHFPLETSFKKSPFSQSLTDINKLKRFISLPDECSTTKKNCVGLLEHVKDSNGYELSVVGMISPANDLGQLRRSRSAKETPFIEKRDFFTPLLRMKKSHIVSIKHLQKGDSGLFKDSVGNLFHVDQACQTEPTTVQEKCVMKRKQIKGERCKCPIFDKDEILV